MLLALAQVAGQCRRKASPGPIRAAIKFCTRSTHVAVFIANGGEGAGLKGEGPLPGGDGRTATIS